MGLHISHGGWSGGYISWNYFRKAICECHGKDFSYPPHHMKDENGVELKDAFGYPLPNNELDKDLWYVGEGGILEGIHMFLSHSDCSGSFLPKECRIVAKDLETVIPLLEAHTKDWTTIPGHIERNGGYVGTLNNYIRACYTAASARQRLRYG